MDNQTKDKNLRLIAAIGLGLGGLLGLVGTFLISSALRGLAWGIDGMALVVASALLTVFFIRKGQDYIAAGYIVFAVGQGIVVSSSAMSLTAASPSFGAGASLWAAALVLISTPRFFPLWTRIAGLLAAALFAVTAMQIYSGAPLDAKSSPLPFFAYPIFVATMVGWILTLLRSIRDRSSV